MRLVAKIISLCLYEPFCQNGSLGIFQGLHCLVLLCIHRSALAVSCTLSSEVYHVIGFVVGFSSIVKILSINSCWSIFRVLQHFNRKNRSDYLSVASVDHTIDLELHCNHLIVWCIDLCVGMLLVVLFCFNMGLLANI